MPVHESVGHLLAEGRAKDANCRSQPASRASPMAEFANTATVTKTRCLRCYGTTSLSGLALLRSLLRRNEMRGSDCPVSVTGLRIDQSPFLHLIEQSRVEVGACARLDQSAAQWSRAVAEKRRLRHEGNDRFRPQRTLDLRCSRNDS